MDAKDVLNLISQKEWDDFIDQVNKIYGYPEQQQPEANSTDIKATEITSA